MTIIQWRDGEKGEGEFKKGGGKSVNWLIKHFSLFSSVFSSSAALIFSSLTNFPPFFTLDFEVNSVSLIFPLNKRDADLNSKSTFEKNELVSGMDSSIYISN